jgi:hypothetical protein
MFIADAIPRAGDRGRMVAKRCAEHLVVKVRGRIGADQQNPLSAVRQIKRHRTAE